MIGENGAPATPDWQPQPHRATERCLDCGRIRVYCEAVGQCCTWCSHERLPPPLLWDGDQA